MRTDNLVQALPDMTSSGLVAELQAYVTFGGVAMVEAICSELMRRTGENGASRKKRDSHEKEVEHHAHLIG